MRKCGPRGDTMGMTTRRMTRVLNSCACKAPTLFLGAVAFRRSEVDSKKVENCMWDFEKLGPMYSHCLQNLDQLLVEIWKEVPIFVSTETDLATEYSQASDDSEELRDYYFKEMYWCDNPECEEIISWDSSVLKCIYCGFQNDLSKCEIFSRKPSGKFLRLYPDNFKPILGRLRNWFEELPTLKVVGLEMGLTTYNFGARVRRQLKIFPRVFHEDNDDRLGILNTGKSNKCLPVPEGVRYEGLQRESWYSNLFESEHQNNHVIFEDKNYLLGESPFMEDNSDSAWI